MQTSRGKFDRFPHIATGVYARRAWWICTSRQPARSSRTHRLSSGSCSLARAFA